MAKGPEFRNGNAARHRERLGDTPLWYVACAEVDVEDLRARLDIEVDSKGSLTYRGRQALKRRISEIRRRRGVHRPPD